MATKLEHRDEYSCTAQQFHAAVATEQFWTDLVNTVAKDVTTLESFAAADGGVKVALQQVIPADKLPSMVAKIRSGDLVIKRATTWGAFVGGGATGQFSAEVQGAPATVSGSITLSGTPTGCAVVFSGEAKVRIPLVGGKIEGAVVSNITTLLDAEREFGTDWLATHAS